MSQDKGLVYERIIQAPIDLIYRAFTSGTALREWLCDIGFTHPEQGGWIFMLWNRGYFASGYYTNLLPEKAISFKWIGKEEPSWTQVDVTIIPLDGEDQHKVVLRHSGIGLSEEWDTARKEISKGWQVGLDNLKSTLECGQDLRIVKRPLIGIYPDDLSEFSQSALEALEIPVKEGVRVREVIPGYGADQVGIQPDDVIIALNGQEVGGVRKLLALMSEFSSGDEVIITAYRKHEKMTFEISAKPQMIEDVPGTPEELAKELESRFSKELESLEGVLEGVTPFESSFSPGPEEWSTKETLVHLILSEREMHMWMNDLISGHERIQDEWPGNSLLRIRATLTAYPTVDDLVAEYKKSLKETVAIVAFLDADFTRRKTSYWRLGLDLMNIHNHIREHINQIEENLREARNVMSLAS